MPVPHHASAGREQWLGLAVLALPTLLVSMDMTILHLATPSLSAALRPSGQELLWMADIYGFLMAGALIPMGALGNRIGKRRLLLGGSVLFGLASVLAGFSGNAAMLIGARAILGVAGAMLLPSTLAIIRGLFLVPRQRSIAIGIWTTCFTLGGVIGPLVGGLLLQHFWWGSVFLVGVPVMAILLVLGPVFLPDIRGSKDHPVDGASVLLSMLAVLAIAYGVKHLAEVGATATALAALLTGGLAGWTFLHRQGQLVHPLVDPGLFRKGAFAAALGANMMALFAWVGASLLVAQYLQLVIGLTPMIAGLWSIPPAIACIAGCLAAPAVARHLAVKTVVTVALLIVAAGFALLAALAPGLGLFAVISGMCVLGLGVATIITLGTDLILTTAPADKAGAASAISETGAELGGAFGVAVLGSVGVAVYQAGVAIPEGIDADRGMAAKATLGAAVELAAALPGSSGAALLASARLAFERGLVLASVMGFCILLGTAILFAWTNLRRSPSQAASRSKGVTK
ncbi:MFS transporter [Paracoccus sp. CPCC 101403]|uniref:MFS transporter n=1 Tax=Paracoccus broussonetiae TaxID=3075834 RepID=A0ABU3EDC7_9RHOB|nr:MFS transporter [Paracoccus sp. CPCC 101403]MDT1062248.1 MFS transporter [Paracoccus sp. CPCC 101403]